ncbi:transporter substrate-binding domain-containing protein [Pseudomonas sp. TWR3-1-1]|uniref:transporter substrate-binding domain-containing protein n=1 Tax=Pseudomonas sp. TWR3-1-1 TaxID=2804633 RepID=UPI003CEBF103
MRLLPGLMLLLPLVSPLAQAELIDDVNDRGELRIALEADVPPYSFKQDGHLTGFEVELGELLAQELDVNASLLVTDSNDLLQGVESGKYDVALNHMALTPDLENRFDFSEPYGYIHPVNDPVVALAIPFQKGNPAFHNSLDKALQRIKADGRLAALSQKWLGPQTPQP